LQAKDSSEFNLAERSLDLIFCGKSRDTSAHPHEESEIQLTTEPPSQQHDALRAVHHREPGASKAKNSPATKQQHSKAMTTEPTIFDTRQSEPPAVSLSPGPTERMKLRPNRELNSRVVAIFHDEQSWQEPTNSGGSTEKEYERSPSPVRTQLKQRRGKLATSRGKHGTPKAKRAISKAKRSLSRAKQTVIKAEHVTSDARYQTSEARCKTSCQPCFEEQQSDLLSMYAADLSRTIPPSPVSLFHNTSNNL
jgi:hypothetical protein